MGEGNIWARLIGNGSFSPEVARGILSLHFSDADQQRMQDLAERNSDGKLAPAEWEELENYVKVGDILSLLHLKAKTALKI